MGFPTWTLFGMGLTVVGALIMLIVAYIAQSPRLLKRLGLSGTRLDLRARTFTGFALALLLLSIGFFVAGVPLGSRSEAVEVASEAAAIDSAESGAMAPLATQAVDPDESFTANQESGSEDAQPVTGAFAGAPPAVQTATAEVLALAAAEATIEAQPTEEVTATATPSPTATATQTPSPTPTSSPTPTTTPTPPFTPTPIFEETALVNTGTSTLWVKRTPAGRDFVLVKGGDIVILLPGHANVGGVIWREVSTVNGESGWVLESYLDQEPATISEVN